MVDVALRPSAASPDDEVRAWIRIGETPHYSIANTFDHPGGYEAVRNAAAAGLAKYLREIAAWVAEHDAEMPK